MSKNNLKVFLGTDHAGFELKEKLVSFISNDLGYEIKDKGAFSYESDDDYPDFISLVAEEVSSNPENSRGIVLGGSGQGEAMVSNSYPNVRAVVFNGQYEPNDGRDVPNEIVISRQHNNSNILSLGARFLNEQEAKNAVKLWLETPFEEEERHQRRIEKIESIRSNLKKI